MLIGIMILLALNLLITTSVYGRLMRHDESTTDARRHDMKVNQRNR